MKQYEVVMKVMAYNGGYATLGQLYQEVLNHRKFKWSGKTPDANIRRIVQEHNDKFYKIRPGLWALVGWENKLPKELQNAKSASEKQRDKIQEFDHSYYQGVILQMGSKLNFETYLPPQDKNRLFLGKEKLGTFVKCEKIYNFSYEELVRKAKTVDVVWFNHRKMPAALFEVEHTTDMTNSMIKFNELFDFRTEMYIVSNKRNRKRFDEVASMNTFEKIKKIVKFISYERLTNDFSNICKLSAYGGVVSGVYANN